MIEILNFNEQTRVSYDQIVDLLHMAFDEHSRIGLDYLASRITVEEYIKRTKNATILLAVDKQSEMLVGTGTIRFLSDDNGIIFAWEGHAAIHPLYKRKGIGTKLLSERERICIEKNCQYIMSDTAKKAASAVNYHLRNGFKIIGLISHPTTNYYSYLFRKQLTHPSPYDYKLYCKFQYLKSSIKTKLLYKENGQKSLLCRLMGKIVKH